MPESKPKGEEEMKKVQGRRFINKILMNIGTFGAKEILAPVAAGLLAILSLNQINTYISGKSGIETVKKEMLTVKDQIKIIRDRQKQMGGPLPEWWDRVIIKGDITSSVNALELKLKTLEAKKATFENTAEYIKPYWDFVMFGLFFAVYIGYMREWIGKILDSYESNWREKGVVHSTNEALLQVHKKLTALEDKILSQTEKIDQVAGDSQVSSESTKQALDHYRRELNENIAILKEIVEQVPEDKLPRK
jgi:hypothetical protein